MSVDVGVRESANAGPAQSGQPGFGSMLEKQSWTMVLLGILLMVLIVVGGVCFYRLYPD